LMPHRIDAHVRHAVLVVQLVDRVESRAAAAREELRDPLRRGEGDEVEELRAGRRLVPAEEAAHETVAEVDDAAVGGIDDRARMRRRAEDRLEERLRLAPRAPLAQDRKSVVEG